MYACRVLFRCRDWGLLGSGKASWLLPTGNGGRKLFLDQYGRQTRGIEIRNKETSNEAVSWEWTDLRIFW